MNWWGNSLEKAVGFSNIASNALKKAQKKLDKVLDIPIEEDGSVSTGNISVEENILESECDKSDILDNSNSIKVEEDFSDIDLASPKQLDLKNVCITRIYDANEQISERLGDWNTQDSLTASQFEIFKDPFVEKNAIKSMDQCDFILCTEKNTKMIESEESYAEDENQPKLFSNRNSTLSISSDCTTSTIRKNVSDIDSSGHTDDFGFANNEVAMLDSCVNEDSVEEENTMALSFQKVSNDSLHDESITAKDRSGEESPKTNIQFNQPLVVICPNKDDIESNTTSSDIELVSCATSHNGDNQQQAHASSRFFLPDYTKHHRSASGSSISLYKIDSGDYPSDPEHLSNQIIDYQKQSTELSRMLDIRESKIIQLSRENIDLRDTINNLTRQIEQVNERQETDATDINALTREFTTRLSEAEKRYQIANKERDSLKKQVVELEKTESQQIDKVIKEKEEQLASLLEEGEKLAQDQLKANNTIKKLRHAVKEKEMENAINIQKVTKLDSEIAYLKKVLNNKEENERKHVEGITQLTKAVEKMEKDNIQLNTLNQVLQERNQSFESALDKMSHEIAQLKKQLLEEESEKNAIQNDYQKLLDQHSSKVDVISDIKSKADLNEREVSLLQKRIQMQSREYGYKEEEYNSRISYLQDRLAEMEQRNEELNEAASVATRPVIRQLEAIQNSCATHVSNWEQIEKNLNSKIMDLQQKLSLSEEFSHTMKEQLQSRDIQSNSLREEKNRIMNQYNQEYNSRQILIDEKMTLENNLSQLQQESKKEKDTFIKRIKDLEYNLSDVRHALEVEKQNSSNVSSKLSSLQMIMSQRQVCKDRSRTSSGTSTVNEIEPDDSVSMVSNRSAGSPDRRNNNTSLYDGLRLQGVAVMMEHLEASLKQKEGQINKLQTELSNLRRSRENVVDEMTQLTQTVEKLETTVKTQQAEIASSADLNDRYNALLQMYGEKIEECEELRMDISEVKEVYRSHIDMLSKTT